MSHYWHAWNLLLFILDKVEYHVLSYLLQTITITVTVVIRTRTAVATIATVKSNWILKPLDIPGSWKYVELVLDVAVKLFTEVTASEIGALSVCSFATVDSVIGRGSGIQYWYYNFNNDFLTRFSVSVLQIEYQKIKIFLKNKFFIWILWHTIF